jgi:hypothetical protein
MAETSSLLSKASLTMTNAISATFPTICELLKGSLLDQDIEWALDIAKSPNVTDDLKLAFKDRMFHLNDLMLVLCCDTILPYPDARGPELETNLLTVIEAVRFAKVRSAYRKKLLINSKDTFEDVRYEIAVAAKACVFLDEGSVDLEVGIDGTNNDSDVRGKYQGAPVRLEVTVLHDSLPPAADPGLEEIVIAAELPSGFIVAIRQTIASESQARRLRTLIEKLGEQHVVSAGADETIDGLMFKWRRGSYACGQDESPIRSIEFDLPSDVRLIERPVFTRSVTPQHMIDDFEQPEGVVTMADVPHDSATHNNNPLSGTIRKKVAEKRKQCEDGVVSLVVLGKPLPMSDNAVEDALFGELGVYVPLVEDSNGIRHGGKPITGRSPKAPFVPADECPDPAQFVDPFRKVSGVWLLRLDGVYGLTRCYRNPNANNPIPAGLADAITDRSANSLASPFGSDSTAREPTKNLSDGDDAAVEIVSTEMAEELVEVCGGYSHAKQVLIGLEQSGATMAELEKTLNRALSPPTDKKEGMRFLSPTNEEVGMQLVVGCGGFEQARFCLDEWAREHRLIEGQSEGDSVPRDPE